MHRVTIIMFAACFFVTLNAQSPSCPDVLSLSEPSSFQLGGRKIGLTLNRTGSVTHSNSTVATNMTSSNYTSGPSPRSSWKSDENARIKAELVVKNRRFNSTERVVGGRPPTAFLPYYLVKFGDQETENYCTATLLNRNWVLTAAHCDYPLNQNTVALFYSGIDNEWTELRQIRATRSHPWYSANENGAIFNDIMLVELASPAPSWSEVVVVNRNGNIPAENSFSRAAGFGDTSFGAEDGYALYQVDMPILSNADCAYFHNSDYNSAVGLCAGYYCGGCDTCQGDSGGPIFLFDSYGRVLQVGITSWGDGCAAAESPGVYARVSAFGPWIDSITSGLAQVGFVTEIIASSPVCAN